MCRGFLYDNKLRRRSSRRNENRLFTLTRRDDKRVPIAGEAYHTQSVNRSIDARFTIKFYYAKLRSENKEGGEFEFSTSAGIQKRASRSLSLRVYFVSRFFRFAALAGSNRFPGVDVGAIASRFRRVIVMFTASSSRSKRESAGLYPFRSRIMINSFIPNRPAALKGALPCPP